MITPERQPPQDGTIAMSDSTFNGKSDPVSNPMSGRARLRRPDPKRSGPIRDFGTFFRDPASRDGSAADAGSSTAPASGTDEPVLEPDGDPVAYGVALGYQVIEEHIRQGRSAAQALRDGGADATGKKNLNGADLGDFLARAAHLYQDAGSLALEVVEYLARNPSLQSLLSRGKPGPPPAADTGDEAAAGGQGQSIGVELITTRPAQAWARLHGGAPPFLPMVDSLRAPGTEAPALTGIRLVRHPSGSGIMLRLEVPDDHPAGTYSGIIVDSDTGIPRGTVCVRLPG